MEYVRKGFRRVKNRIVNRPSAVQKRYYLKLRAQLDPLRRPSDSGPNRPVLMISGITMRGTGIFCNLLAFLRWVDFAQRMGYIPVIDMQNVENLYLEDELLGKVNAYEYFYRQPAGIGVEEGYRARELYIVNRLDCPYDFTRAQKKAYREAVSYTHLRARADMGAQRRNHRGGLPRGHGALEERTCASRALTERGCSTCTTG